MTFRRKLMALFALTVFLSVVAVSWLVVILTRNAFEKAENDRTAALVQQFQTEFQRRGEDVERKVAAIASSDTVSQLAMSLNGAPADSAQVFDVARSLAESRQLDFLELLDDRGTILSSAQAPAKFGYPETAFQSLSGLTQQNAFLKLEELPDASVLGMFAARATRVGDHPLYVIGGRRLDQSFLAALDAPPEMQILLYENRSDGFSPDRLIGATIPKKDTNESLDSQGLAALIEAVRHSNQEMTGGVKSSSGPGDAEVFHAIPLHGAGQDRPLLAVLLIGNSRRQYFELKRHIRDSALMVGAGGIILAILLSSWIAARVTRPVEQLAAAAQQVAGGNWNSHVDVQGHDEVAQLAESFNRMTTELLTQKERLVQTERVAAWRELARRLAHELKNPLFPLQLTVENLIRARTQYPEQFDEVFRESSTTLLAEISNLKGIIGRFSDFSKMPQPQLQSVNVNEVVNGVAQLFQAQLQTPGRPSISQIVQLEDGLPLIAADPELLHKAFSNLVLNAMDSMANGGTLTMRTHRSSNGVVIEIADTGSGLTLEECERIFTPYYTSKQHGTGLGLAIVQSVISDHGGRISVHSETGRGTTFTIELPENPDAMRAIKKTSEKPETISM